MNIESNIQLISEKKKELTNIVHNISANHILMKNKKRELLKIEDNVVELNEQKLKLVLEIENLELLTVDPSFDDLREREIERFTKAAPACLESIKNEPMMYRRDVIDLGCE